MNLKKYVPLFVYRAYMVIQTYCFDCRKTLKYSFCYRHEEENLKANLVMVIHTVEKGLTMPHARTNFGHERILDIIRLTNIISDRYPTVDGSHCFEVLYALETLDDYIAFHWERKVVITPDILKAIEDLAAKHSYTLQRTSFRQYRFTRETFFNGADADFCTFAKSRHTCRYYCDKEIPDEVFQKVAEIAQTAPSSCNRQTCKFYVIKDLKLMDKVLAIQGGNRGFGETATATIVITSRLTAFSDVQERNQPSINAGFYGMNILYALHYYHVGACVLNWANTRKKDAALRRLLPQIHDEEQICMLISCGYPAANFDTALSKRKPTETNFEIIK